MCSRVVTAPAGVDGRARSGDAGYETNRSDAAALGRPASIERNRGVILDRSDLVNQAITASAQTLGCVEHVAVLQADSSQPASLDRVFDVVFLDPPFASNLVAPCLEWLLASNLLRSDTLLYLETPKAVTVHDERLQTLKEKTMGDVTCRLMVQR